ncbi:hypothetical protein JVX98_11400 [Ensifer sp. PDNC004]|uniref:hypothetical protein n=1 Tax=Ensifer sp. PDNC004 TaxID=2811423 RepID=UPI0019654143|nr:hypothetical protein [Ensifer sp. PDNC004]QRY68844.1 hypothetical protein JVX98_11400 [Ensifer sp. PDNC004]
MSGRGQHFIPQHFQKPFTVTDSKDQLWLHRRGKREPILVARSDAAKQRDFYSEPNLDGVNTLDDLITEYEHTIFALVDELRHLSAGSQVDGAIAAEVAVHFAVRSSHTRSVISAASSGLAKALSAIIREPQMLGSRRLPSHRPPEAISQAILERITANEFDKVTGVNSSALMRIAYIAIREQIDQLVDEARSTLSVVVDQFADGAKTMARDTHRKMLSESLAPRHRVSVLQELSWKIVAHECGAAILPDCICIASDSSGKWMPLILGNDISLLVLPLSPNALLVGKIEGELSFEAADFNSIAASSCFDFFLAKEPIGIKGFDSAALGGSVRSQIDGLISGGVLEAFDEYFRVQPSDQASALEGINEYPEPSGHHSYQISLFDFGDNAFAQEVATALIALIDEYGLGQACLTIDGFTFAHDYQEAIKTVERGFQTSGPIQTIASPLATGVAMPITVLRDNRPQTRFVIRGFVAEGLASSDDEYRRMSAEVIRDLLAGASLDFLVRTRFSSWMLRPIETPIESFFYGHAGGLFDVYFRSRASALDLRDADSHIESLQEHLPQIIADCITRRRAYRTDADLDGFLDFAFSNVKLLLLQIVRVLGAHAAVAKKATTPAALEGLLREYQLSDWARLFANDLDQFYLGLDEWNDFEQIFFTHRHFERWLLLLGIVVEEKKDGTFYVHVPIGIDAEYLEGLQH